MQASIIDQLAQKEEQDEQFDKVFLSTKLYKRTLCNIISPLTNAKAGDDCTITEIQKVEKDSKSNDSKDISKLQNGINVISLYDNPQDQHPTVCNMGELVDMKAIWALALASFHKGAWKVKL